MDKYEAIHEALLRRSEKEEPLPCPTCGQPGTIYVLDIFRYMACEREGCNQAAGWMYGPDVEITHWLNPYKEDQRFGKYPGQINKRQKKEGA